MVTVARSRRHPVRHLALEHHDDARHAAALPQHVEHDRRADVVGQVPDHQEPGRGRVARGLREVDRRRVGLDDPHLLRETDAQGFRKPAVLLYHRQRAARQRQRRRERPAAGADLDHRVARPGLERPHDARDDRPAVQEDLP